METVGAPDAFEVVINYRREDTSGHAGRLYDALAEHFGSEHVFMDIDAIDPGADFGEVIAGAVDRCQAFIALIGKRWLTATDDRGRRRLDNPDDFVRIEIEAALQRDIRVIPVLVQDVEMPSSEDLPPSLQPLARRNALEIRDSSWRYDVDRLIATLDQFAGRAAAEDGGGSMPPDDAGSEGWTGRRAALIAAGGLLLAIAVIGAVLLAGGGGDQERRGLLFVAGGHLYATGLSGKNELDLTGARGPDETPAWSPDREQIAFARDSHIWIMRSDGSDAHQVTNGAQKDGSPDWSPRDDRIVFDRRVPRTEGDVHTKFDVVVRDADGSEVNLTPSAAATGGSPDWSPKGNRIVFQRQTRLWLMRDDGSEPEQVRIDFPPGTTGTIVHPAWAPDGSLIAFTLRARDTSSDIWVVNRFGENLQNLTRGRLRFPDGAAWSPDSLRLVVAARDGLWLVEREGEVERMPLATSQDLTPPLMTPAWAP
jgi:Tol biopolymer transport system component